jgi:hypothetical protein
MAIGIVGDPEDLTSVYLGWLAGKRGTEVAWLAERTLGADWAWHIERDLALVLVAGVPAPFDGLYVRLNPEPGLPDGIELEHAKAQAFAVERRAGLQFALDRYPGLVVNRPAAGRSNGSKPYQMNRLAASGLAVPAWVTTNDPDMVRDFVAAAPDGAIYKAVSGLRSRVRRVDDELERALVEGTTPVLVQEFVPGREVRIHTLGGLAFATAVTSAEIDYRYDENGAGYRATEAPPELARLCSAIAAAEGLVIAGFDFRVSADGTWYCLEMNPVPTFMPYEMATGQPIGNAVLDLLAANHAREETARITSAAGSSPFRRIRPGAVAGR